MSKLTANRLIFEKIAEIRAQQTAAAHPFIKAAYQREIDRLVTTVIPVEDIPWSDYKSWRIANGVV